MQITIRSDGQIEFVRSDALAAAYDAVGAERAERRASHVEPVCAPLRTLFRAIRRRVRDDSVLATFTRYWPVRWRVAIVGGPTFGPFWSRRAAIRAEIEWLNENEL